MTTFKPGPIQEPIETPPRRKPGPKPGQPRPTSKTSLKPQIAGMLMTLNLALYVIPPLRADVLDTVEIEALARALDDQAKQNAKFRKALETALSAGSGGTLIGIAALIGARRAARHGFLPVEMDNVLGDLMAQGLAAPKSSTSDGG